jgi:hypothetical protein
MKTTLNIIIGLLLIANLAFGVGFYNYLVEGENKTWQQMKNLKSNNSTKIFN